MAESEKLSWCDGHTLSIKYLNGTVVVKACMKDYEEEKPHYCNYLGTVDWPSRIPIAATGVCVTGTISKDTPLLVSKL